MKKYLLLGTMLLLALFASACGSAVTDIPDEAGPLATSVSNALETASPAVGEALQTASPAVGEAIATLASPAVVNTQPANATATAEIPVTGDTMIRASMSDTHGPILVDGEGTPVYIFTSDTQNGTTSACVDEECTAEWSPVTTSGSPVAGAGVVQSLLGTITREDGTLQVTYNGWPLYYSASGSIGEHAAEGTWFLITPSGKQLAE